MHFFNLSQFFKFSQFFNEMKNNEEESFLSSVKCRIRTVYYGLVFQMTPPAKPGCRVLFLQFRVICNEVFLISKRQYLGGGG